MNRPGGIGFTSVCGRLAGIRIGRDETMLPGTVSPRTEDVYGNIVRNHLIPAVGRARLTKLTPSDVSAMLVDLERKGCAPETRRMARAVLRRALAPGRAGGPAGPQRRRHRRRPEGPPP